VQGYEFQRKADMRFGFPRMLSFEIVLKWQCALVPNNKKLDKTKQVDGCFIE